MEDLEVALKPILSASSPVIEIAQERHIEPIALDEMDVDSDFTMAFSLIKR
jgi:hypothetical protein